MEGLYSVGPILAGIGLNLTAWSYVDALHVAALGCPSSLPDPWRLTDLLPGALAELVEECCGPAGDVAQPDRASA
jgi:hypothetical protein